MRVVDRLADTVAKWATATRISAVCATFLAMAIAVGGAAIALGDPPFDAFGRPIAEDFVAKSIGGRIAADGRHEDLYDVPLQRRAQVEILGRREGYEDRLNPFLSPPFVAELYAPFASLSYPRAVAIWTILSIATLVASLAALAPLVPVVRSAGLPRLLLVTFSLQPALELLGNGQDGALSLAILVAGLRLLTSGRDVAAGAVLGLGAFKPQIFFLMPLLLALEHRPRALFAGASVVALLAIASLWLVGLEGAGDYLALLRSDLYRRGIGDDLRWKMLSLPSFAGALLPTGWRASTERVIQVSCALGAAALLVAAVRAARRDGSRPSILPSYAAAVLLTACANPHFFLHDGLVLLVPIAVLLGRSPSDPRLRALLVVGAVLSWTAPLRELAFGALPWPLSIASAPWPAVVIALLAARAVRTSSAAPARTP